MRVCTGITSPQLKNVWILAKPKSIFKRSSHLSSLYSNLIDIVYSIYVACIRKLTERSNFSTAQGLDKETA